MMAPMIAAQLMQGAAQVADAAPQTHPSAGVVKTKTAVLRREPRKSAHRVGLLRRGKRVNILGEENGWTNVVASLGQGEVRGWIKDSSLDTSDEDSGGQ